MRWQRPRSGLEKVWRSAGWLGETTLSAEVGRAVERHPEMRLLYRGTTSANWSLRDIATAGRRAAEGLRRLGFRQGDVVVAQVPNWPESHALLYGCLLLGVAIIPVIHIYGPAELEFIARQSQAKGFIAPGTWRQFNYAERFERVARCPSIERIVNIGDQDDTGAVSWRQLIEAPELDPSDETQDPEKVCLVVYTSGTTSEPKGVQHTHQTVISELRTMAENLQTIVGKPYLSAQPAGHVAGLLGFLRSITYGAPVSVFLDAWDAELAAQLIHDHAINATTGPPFYLTTLLDAVERDADSILTVNDYMTGGERVPAALIERADLHGVRAYRSYGSTEHPTVSTSRASDPLSLRAQTDGRISVGVSVRIVDDDERTLRNGEDGEVLTLGPDLFVGYTDDKLNESAFTPDGFFRTGDIGHIDHSGVLTITDRKKDIIIRGGENISSREVEEIMLRHPAVADVAVIAMPDDKYGERVCAVTILYSGTSLSIDDVRRHFLASGVARQKTPERIEVVTDVPRTLVGKIRKNELRSQLFGR